ncbi:MAG TPA: hypothetical protein VLY24_22670 [Bryobacteraceae bacterium]|nr:hypothetical protein [Bryobacteraceae bacterium]
MKQWSAEDGTAILSYSPWAERVTPQWVRDLSPDERRAGGDLQADQGKGVGLDGLIGIFDSEREAAAIARAHEKPDPGTFMVRWESARPVRTALQLAPDREAPTLDSEAYYAIVVYDFPTPKNWSEGTLKGVAFLKRHDKKDLKPARVMIERKDDGLATLVYLFPRPVEITKRDISKPPLPNGRGPVTACELDAVFSSAR